MTKQQRDGPITLSRARLAVAEALSAWLMSPYSVGDTSLGGPSDDDMVIYGPDESRFPFTLVLDARRGRRHDGTVYVTSDMFYREGETWLMIDSPASREKLRAEIERLTGNSNVFPSEEEVAVRYRAKALRALSTALSDWPWLRTRLRRKPTVEVAGTELVITAGEDTLARFTVTFTASQASNAIHLSLRQFTHPAVRDWEFVDEPDNWQTLQHRLEALLRRLGALH